jgi:multimeric flavodoxin WrbA
VKNLFNLNKIDAAEDSLMSKLNRTISFLHGKKTLILGCSNRWKDPNGKRDIPKTERIGKIIEEKLAGKANYIDVFNLKIHSCEANISHSNGNNCGVLDSKLKDNKKNPSGYHRCWASLNNKDDDLWKISKPMLESDAVLFIAPVRWGQACATYQKLIERLSWLENRHATLKEDNLLSKINAGFICLGHNWNGDHVLETQKKVLKFFGFDVREEMCWRWQWTSDEKEESLSGYKEDYSDFKNQIVKLTIKNTK